MTAEHVEFRGIDVRIKTGGFDLVEDDSSSLWEVRVEKPVPLCYPMLIARVSNIPLLYAIVAPARRFAHDGPVHHIEAVLIQGRCVFNRENAVIEKVPVDVVGKKQTILGIALESLMQIRRTAVSVVFADHVIVDSVHALLGVPGMITPPPFRIETISRGVPVLVGPVRIAVVEVGNHIVDKVRYIEVFPDRLIPRIRRQADSGEVEHLSIVLVGAIDNIALMVLEHIVVFLIAAEI